MRRVLAVVFSPLLLIAMVLPAPASAETSKAAYGWHIADEFLQEAVGSPPWAIASAPNGESLALQGTGTLNGGSKTADGGGLVVHYAPDGSVVGTGTFEVTGLRSFHFYGCGGEGVPDFLCGGQAIVNAVFTPDAAPDVQLKGTIWIDCLLGDKIPPSAQEGIRVSVPSFGNFNHTHHSGFTVFTAG